MYSFKARNGHRLTYSLTDINYEALLDASPPQLFTRMKSSFNLLISINCQLLVLK